MQRDGRRIAAIANHRHHLPKPRPRALRNHFFHECQANPTPPSARRDIDRIFHREAIGRPGPVGAGIGVAQQAFRRFGDQIGEARCQHGIPPAGHFGRIWWFHFKTRQPMRHPMGVNCCDSWDISGAAVANKERLHGDAL